ncbi:envelope stress response membrane protein PspC [Wenzhouxiangella sp. XN79A]|uniref:envelope stress response membrane protein PspC n=1 Tax=Wenzhouxiangella sp. XN79A TaxID=2724193 RepID=UPI00144A554F|nr:envelope stress response membrane protein PspC [Wenzhouxiangella sp. XN79A]NKI35950.1 envelope stress response membrane protein PspC [Wenzhouxiangella sp. XN79A]
MSAATYHNRNRLYRNRERGLIAGVCAGIADWTGFNLTALRVVVVLLAIPFTAVMVIGYLVLALLLPVKPADLYKDAEDERFWTETRRAPVDSVSALNQRFQRLDERLQKLEKWLTSRQYRIRSELDEQ